MTKKKSTTKLKSHSHENNTSSNHADHTGELLRFKRIKGQIEGVERMILDHRYCPDIIMQIRAVTSALKGLETAVLQNHLRGCVRSAMESKNAFASEKKIQEILEIFK